MSRNSRGRFSIAAAREGKLGLALSGGGFRAALFHIGVLARLAERDLLRQISVISTVSGGAIIGAFYYLKVKRLLEDGQPDGQAPSAAAYRQLVRELEREFLAAVQRDLRSLAFADHHQNARMLASRYSASQRMADLFDSCFFHSLSGVERMPLRDIPIASQYGNDLVVPKLIINATALNTGHQFQLTGTFIGEPPISSVMGGSSAMPRLPRLAMDDEALSPRQRARLRQLTLGQAVAASCSVPGLFEPFSLEGLYLDDRGEDITLRLVDGGVFDNQGLVSLFEEDCSHFICSDASESLQWQSRPPELIHQVALRANDIMMDRIRNESMAELLQHEPDRYAVFTLGDGDGATVFGSDGDRFLQALRDIRTDLDAFSDLEACALMYHGYRLSALPLGEAPMTVAGSPQGEGWFFLGIEALAADPGERGRLLRHLQVGSRQFLKVFYVGRPLPWVIIGLLSLIPIALSALLIYLLPPVPTAAWIILVLLILIAIAFVQNARIIEWLDQVEWVRRWRRRLATALRPIGATTVLGAVGALASWFNLRIFNPLFLRYGKLGDQGQR
jgi:NTE family protein